MFSWAQTGPSMKMGLISWSNGSPREVVRQAPSFVAGLPPGASGQRRRKFAATPVALSLSLGAARRQRRRGSRFPGTRNGRCMQAPRPRRSGGSTVAASVAAAEAVPATKGACFTCSIKCSTAFAPPALPLGLFVQLGKWDVVYMLSVRPVHGYLLDGSLWGWFRRCFSLHHIQENSNTFQEIDRIDERVYKKAGMLQVILLWMQIRPSCIIYTLKSTSRILKAREQISVLVSDLTHILFSLY